MQVGKTAITKGLKSLKSLEMQCGLESNVIIKVIKSSGVKKMNAMRSWLSTVLDVKFCCSFVRWMTFKAKAGALLQLLLIQVYTWVPATNC